MDTSDFFYDLPPRLIAQAPIEPRDSSRMLVCNRDNPGRRHALFSDFPEYVRPGDVVVVNHTRVIPARLLGAKEGTGVLSEILLLRRVEQDVWETLVRPGRRLHEGAVVSIGGGMLRAVIGQNTDSGGRLVRFLYEGLFENLLERLGEMPLPPYIHEKLSDGSRYQTVYARVDGSAAAPTAGLHFTPEVLANVRERGADIIPILLHVGLGTFRPVKSGAVEDHVMHAEYYEVSEEAAARINATRNAGGRIICVGTTSVRTLETSSDENGLIRAGSGMTDIFIRPGVGFKAVDMLLTNFHLPESTLLMLVSAFMGRENALAAYQDAIVNEYRFFSFGDCMLIGKELVSL